jgi:hypothetical protein
MVTNGTIMKIEPEKLLQHTLLNSVGVNSVITYEFGEKNGITTLRSREDFTNPVTDKEYTDASEGWDAALRAVKETAEKTK